MSLQMQAASMNVAHCLGCVSSLYEMFLDRGVVVVDSGLKVLSASPTAESILSDVDGLESRDNHLTTPRLTERKLLADAVTQIANRAREPGPVACVRVVVPRPSGRRPYVLTIMRTQQHDTDTPSLHLDAVISIHDLERGPCVAKDMLQAVFNLTPREARLTELLSHGLPVSDACAQMHVSTQTGRGYLKSVFRKTRTNRQSMLVGLVVSLSTGTL